MSGATDVTSVGVRPPIPTPDEAPGRALSREALEEVGRLIDRQLAPLLDQIGQLKEVQGRQVGYGTKQRERITALEDRITALETSIEMNLISIQALQFQVEQLNVFHRQYNSLTR